MDLGENFAVISQLLGFGGRLSLTLRHRFVLSELQGEVQLVVPISRFLPRDAANYLTPRTVRCVGHLPSDTLAQMPTIHFRGRILPAHSPITTPRLPEIDWRQTSDGPLFPFAISIRSCVVDVACTLEKYNPDENLSLLLNQATLYSRAVLDCLCFAHGLGLSLVLEEVVEPDGTAKPLQYSSSRLARLSTAFNLTPGYIGKDDYSAMFSLIAREPALMQVFNDLIIAHTIPGHVAVNCGRAIEGLRNLLVPNDPKRKKAWAEMKRVLRLESAYIEFVTAASTNPRHGDKSYLDQATTFEILDRSWIIMNRFLEFRKRGSSALPPHEFPSLS